MIDVQKDNTQEILMEITQGRDPDVFFECSGVDPVLRMGLKLLKKNSRAAQVGLFTKLVCLDLDDMVYRGIQLATSMGYTLDMWHRSIGHVEKGMIDLKSLVSHKVELSRWHDAFRLCEEKAGFKILVISE